MDWKNLTPLQDANLKKVIEVSFAVTKEIRAPLIYKFALYIAFCLIPTLSIEYTLYYLLEKYNAKNKRNSLLNRRRSGLLKNILAFYIGIVVNIVLPLGIFHHGAIFIYYLNLTSILDINKMLFGYKIPLNRILFQCFSFLPVACIFLRLLIHAYLARIAKRNALCRLLFFFISIFLMNIVMHVEIIKIWEIWRKHPDFSQITNTFDKIVLCMVYMYYVVFASLPLIGILLLVLCFIIKV